jgi:hypothetical protein
MQQQQPEQSQVKTRAQLREQVINEELQKKGMKRLEDIGKRFGALEEEPMAKTSVPSQRQKK